MIWRFIYFGDLKVKISCKMQSVESFSLLSFDDSLISCSKIEFSTIVTIYESNVNFILFSACEAEPQSHRNLDLSCVDRNAKALPKPGEGFSTATTSW